MPNKNETIHCTLFWNTNPEGPHASKHLAMEHAMCLLSARSHGKCLHWLTALTGIFAEGLL